MSSPLTPTLLTLTVQPLKPPPSTSPSTQTFPSSPTSNFQNKSPTRFRGHSHPRPKPTSRSPPPQTDWEPGRFAVAEMQFMGELPPTPTPSLPSPSQRGSVHLLKDFSGSLVKASMFANAEAGPSSAHSLPPTPPVNDDDLDARSSFNLPSSSLAFAEPVLQQRPRRGRRPASVYPVPTEAHMYQPHRKYTDPTPRRDFDIDLNDNAQQLDVDLDAYSTIDFEEGREPTLSFATTSTAESTTGTPASIGGQYEFKPHSGEGKLDSEPRIRMRTTAGRTNAYSSAESSMASGPYSYHAYAENNIYHPHPPPMPDLPSAYAVASDVGLGITAHDVVLPAHQRESQVVSSPGSNPPLSPSHSFSHRPWKRDVNNRLRSDSATSSITTASTDSTHSANGQSSSSHALSFPYAAYAQDLPWDNEKAPDTPDAVALVDEGKEMIFDVAKLEEIGGMEELTEEIVHSLTGVTHLLLPDVGPDIASHLPLLLSTLARSLVVLDLSSNYLLALPEELQYCTLLEELNIADNQIRVLPGWVGELTGLRMLVVDGCGLQSLPSEISMLTGIHTVCARRNRLVSLPSWLCLLGQLETLRVDENPFASEWLPIVTPILASPPRRSYPIPPRSSSQRPDLHSQASVASFTSTRSSTQSGGVPVSSSTATIASDGWMSPTSSATQSVYQQSGLGPIAEDHPHSAPMIQPVVQPLASPQEISPAQGAPNRSLRKMRSAGTLIDQLSQFAVGTPPTPRETRELASPANLAPSTSSRFHSLGSRDGRRAATAMGDYDSEADFSPPTQPRNNSLTPSTSSKSGKWGFLRKMSMNRLRSSDKTSLAASASANLKSLPPPLVHANSDMGPTPPTRPVINMNRSAMTLPTRQSLTMSTLTTNDFGQTALPPSASTLATLPSSGSMFGGIGSFAAKRGKRRSFLPVDGPPSINISIPSTSPFMPTVPIFDPRPHARPPNRELPLPPLPTSSSEASFEDNSMTVSASVPNIDPTGVDPETRYATGLESIKSYLRDMFDLSRPPIEPYGGFEVVATGDSNYAPSTAPSDTTSPASTPNIRDSVSEARGRRSRRPTLDTQMSRDDTASVIESEQGLFAESAGSGSGKKFKNDPSKRVRVIREIYETERTYVRGLGELVAIYVKPAAQPINPGKASETLVPAAERKVVFGGIESILTIHRDNLLPALERAMKPLLDGTDDDEGDLSARTAHAVGEVFRTYIAYMKQYSTYINNFDNALSRMKTWTAPSSNPGTPAFGARPSPTTPSISSAAISVGVGLGSVSLPIGDSVPHSGSPMSTSQRKRVKTFLKRCKEHPMHSQINLESYLLLPIQRVPRYKLLLEDLAMCTPTRTDGPRDTLDDALNEIASLASLMNEEKRDADSRLRLYHWQQRITSRGPSPLVQPHRKLIMDGALTLIRLVKKASTFVEVDTTMVVDAESTITPSKVVVPVEYIAPEPLDRSVMLVLCSDLLVLLQQRVGQGGWDGQVDLYNVLRMATLREPASIVHGNVLRVVDNKSIYYFNGGSQSSTLQWCRAINTAKRR